MEGAGGATCSYCGERMIRGSRTRHVDRPRSWFSYEHHFWACSGCGREWEDEQMREVNLANAELMSPMPMPIAAASGSDGASCGSGAKD